MSKKYNPPLPGRRVRRSRRRRGRPTTSFALPGYPPSRKNGGHSQRVRRCRIAGCESRMPNKKAI